MLLLGAVAVAVAVAVTFRMGLQKESPYMGLPTPSPGGPAGQKTTQQNHTITLCIADTGA